MENYLSLENNLSLSNRGEWGVWGAKPPGRIFKTGKRGVRGGEAPRVVIQHRQPNIPRKNLGNPPLDTSIPHGICYGQSTKDEKCSH